VPEPFWKKFDRGDENKDGFLEGAELDKAFLDPDNVAEAPLVPFGYLISGLVLAGGSSGVNSLFTAFGFRQRVRR